MASRRIILSEKGVLEKDDADFKPKDGEKSDIAPAVPAYVYVLIKSYMRLSSNTCIGM
jgi:hypothetical protein